MCNAALPLHKQCAEEEKEGIIAENTGQMRTSRQEAGAGELRSKAAEQGIEPKDAVGTADANEGEGHGKEAAANCEQRSVYEEAQERQHKKIQKDAVDRQLKIVIEENGQGKELKEQGLGEAGEQRVRGKGQLCCEGQGKDRAEAQLKAGTEEKVGMGAQQQEAGGGECRQHVVGAAQRAGQELEEQHNDGAQCGAGAAREDAVA